MLAEFSEHEADRSETEECKRSLVQVFPVLGQSAAAVKPSEGSLDNPALWQNNKTLGLVGAFDDLDMNASQLAADGASEYRALIATVSVEFAQERIQAEQHRQQLGPAIAILPVGGQHNGLHQQTLRVDQDVPLLALDLLARVVPGRIATRPPFSALLTLWLSMIATVGLASWSASSRHLT